MSNDEFSPNAGGVEYDFETISTLKECLSKFEEKVTPESGDYVKDGVLFCGRCNTPRQQAHFDGTLFGVRCACREAENKKRRQEQVAAENAQRIELARAASLKAPAYRKMRFENDDKHNSKISYLCKQYAENFSEMKKNGVGLIFTGGVGSGKTFYAFAIANALIDARQNVLAERLSNLISRFQTEYKNRLAILREISECDLLVIDDFGAERNTEFAQEAIFDIIDTRCTSCRPMIVTSNLKLDELQNPQDMNYNRIYSRILERCVPVYVTGKSRREDGARRAHNALKDILGA